MILINGKSYKGKSISIHGDNLLIDGIKVNVKSKDITVSITGSIAYMSFVCADENDNEWQCNCVVTNKAAPTVEPISIKNASIGVVSNDVKVTGRFRMFGFPR